MMVIREILDGLDKERAAHEAALRRLAEMRDRILSCCRDEAKATEERKGKRRCQDQAEGRKAA